VRSHARTRECKFVCTHIAAANTAWTIENDELLTPLLVSSADETHCDSHTLTRVTDVVSSHVDLHWYERRKRARTPCDRLTQMRPPAPGCLQRCCSVARRILSHRVPLPANTWMFTKRHKSLHQASNVLSPTHHRLLMFAPVTSP